MLGMVVNAFCLEKEGLGCDDGTESVSSSFTLTDLFGVKKKYINKKGGCRCSERLFGRIKYFCLSDIKFRFDVVDS